MSNENTFTPVPRSQQRHDGWSDQKQRDFIAALSECGIVRAAAEKVGMSTTSAYQLRNSEGADSFAAAWDAALKTGVAQLQDVAMDRVLNGVVVPQFYKGKQVGERRWFDNRLLMYMLRQTNTRRFGPLASHYDYVDEVRAAEAATEKRRRDQLVEVRALIAAIDKDLEDMEDDVSQEAYDALDATRNRLEELAEKLGAVDSYDAEMKRLDDLGADGTLAPKYVRHFKKQAAARYREM